MFILCVIRETNRVVWLILQLDDDSHFNETVQYDVLKRMRKKKLWMAAAEVTGDPPEVSFVSCHEYKDGVMHLLLHSLVMSFCSLKIWCHLTAVHPTM